MLNCKYGCGYTNEHRGAMNLHEKIHCKKKEVSEHQPPSNEKKINGSAARRYCDCEGEGSWTFLSRTNSSHALAIRSGYKKICTECGEVI